MHDADTSIVTAGGRDPHAVDPDCIFSILENISIVVTACVQVVQQETRN